MGSPAWNWLFCSCQRKAQKPNNPTAIASNPAAMAAPLSRAALEAAISKYGPILHVHPDEKYSLCSIDWFLSHSTLVDSKDASKNILHPLSTQLPQLPKEGTRYYFNIEDSVKSGNPGTAKAYVNAFWKPGMAYTDIQFWFFSAYNGPGTARFDSLVWNKVKHTGDIGLAPLGEHVGDWEYCAIRVDNTTKELLGIILSAHGKNILSSKAEVDKNFTMINGTHPAIYASLNGHANFPGVGPNFTEHRKVLGVPVGLEFNLLNTTADGGFQLDTSAKYEVVNAPWLNGTPEAYTTPAWVGYPYRWGPEGTAVTMDSKTLGEFIEAALGPDAGPVVDSCVVLAASELLHIFVKANINGSAAPATQGPWNGGY